jgi:NADH dehydrogenase
MLDDAEVARPLRGMLHKFPNVDFRMATVQSIHLDARRLRTEHGELVFDYAILCAGSTTNFFGNRSAEQRGYGLKDLDEALRLRCRILQQFEAARWTDDPERRRELLSFVVVGGGPTGIECAGALIELINSVLKKDFRGMDLSQVEVMLVEGSEHLLAPFSGHLQHIGHWQLSRKGVKVRFNSIVQEVREGEVMLRDGTVLRAGTVIWTAGVKANRIPGIPQEVLGRGGAIKVEPTLQLHGHPHVYVAGDMAAIQAGDGVLPMVAQVAMQGAECAARNIVAAIKGSPQQPFRYHDKGMMATIGRYSAVVQTKRMKIHGFAGWLAWLFLHLLYLASFRSKVITLVDWGWDYLLQDRPVRLIVGGDVPPD